MTNFKYILLAAVVATPVVVAALPAGAQTGPQVLVVDVDRVATTCTACTAAGTQFQAQVQQAQTRADALRTQLQTTGAPLQTAVNALSGRQPDAALQARITAFETQQNSASQELQQTQARLQSTQQNINRQIGERLIPITETIRNQRGASVVLSRGSALAAGGTADVTNEVLTALNSQLTSISVTPLPQQAGAGTAAPGAATPTTRPRTSGR